MTEPSSEQFQQALDEALSAVVGTLEGGICLRWVVLVESLAPQDSKPGVWQMAKPGMAAWETLGLLEYAAARERLGAVDT